MVSFNHQVEYSGVFDNFQLIFILKFKLNRKAENEKQMSWKKCVVIQISAPGSKVKLLHDLNL